MAIGLVPYQWKTDGMTRWELPAGVTASIDLRRSDQISDTKATGYAIAIYPGSLPAGSVALDTGNVTRDRDAWLATLGFRPSGTNAIEWTWSQLTEGADDTHAAACRPLRTENRDRAELWLGTRYERALSATERTRQLLLCRNDLNAIFDEVVAGHLPPNMHRKALMAAARRLGLDWQTVRPAGVRWQNETAAEPATDITDDFPAGGYVALNTYNSWTTPTSTLPFTVGSGQLRIEGFVSGLANGSSHFAWNGTTLSDSNNQADFVSCTTNNFIGGVVCRGNGTSTGYAAACFSGNLYLYVVTGLTNLGSIAKAADPVRLRVQAIGSTIKASDNGSTWSISVTNTAISSGLRVGAYLFANSTYSGQYVTADSFYATDFIAAATRSTWAKRKITRGFKPNGKGF